jgi:PqqD family protein of HPr-rel-A system
MFRQVDDEWVVFDPAANDLHVLNLSAALIWSHLTGDCSEADIAAAVQEAFGIEPQQAESDVREALGRFRSAGLLAGDA